MADPKVDAVIEQLMWTKIQLMAQAPLQADKDKIEIRINKTILNIKLEERQAIAAGYKDGWERLFTATPRL